MRRRWLPLGITALLVAVAFAAMAFAHPAKKTKRTVTVTPDEKAAFDAAKPAFEKHCFRCHTTSGKKAKRKTLDHLTMDSYPFGGHHANDVASSIRRTLGIAPNKKKPTMPKDEPGAVVGDDLERISAWADSVDRARAESRADKRR